MRFPALRAFYFCAALLAGSCQHEYSLENARTGIARGTLKTVAGDCMPSGSHGSFRKGMPVDSTNYIYVDINVSTTGTYLLTSDTVNGLSFKAEGTFETTGIHTVRLEAGGTPFTNGTVPYPVHYGTQRCIVNVFSADPASTASGYSWGGAGSNCTGAILSGNYIAGTAMTVDNKVVLDVSVSNNGVYSISTPAVNGVQFSASGSFSAAGPQQVTLVAAGIPVSDGSFDFSVSPGTESCRFAVTFR
jgi:hypothetical protein